MAPSYSRQLLVWSFPTIAILLSYLWYKKKRIGGVQSDPGDKNSISAQINYTEKEIKENKDITNKNIIGDKTPQSSPNRSFSRSLSGVESQPIDIIIPRELKSIKSNPIVISDEDLDFEIEKIKSMRYGTSIDFNKKTKSPEINKEKISPIKDTISPSPAKINFTTPTMSKNTLNNNDKIKIVEEKFPSLNLNCPNEMTPPSKNSEKKKLKKNQESKRQNDELQKQNSDRDSANHSPADVMLASPSLSCISDNHSEGSNDSGKGGSDVATPPPSRTPGTDGNSISGDINIPIIYEFIIPQTLVGKLIGKHGSFVTLIKNKTNSHILVKKHPTNNKLKVCVIEGYQKDIDNALKLIRDKFPLKRFPEMTLEQVSFLTQVAPIPLVPDHLYLKLVEGVNNDTIVSCMVSPNHLFLQQPTHPTFPNLNILTSYMNVCYNEADSPLLPKPIPENTICVAFSIDSWCRAIILSTDQDNDTSYVKFLDYGGYAYVENSQLRQIRGDFMLLPFQAAECFLANIKPIEDNASWPEEAYHFVADLTKGAIIYTQIVDYTEEDVPLVHCYLVIGPQVIFLNQELVNQGYAEWISYNKETQSVQQQQQQQSVEGAVGGVTV